MPEPLGARFRLVHEMHERDPTYAYFLAHVLDDERRHLQSDHWATSERSLAGLGGPLMRSVDGDQETTVVELGEALVLVSLHGGFLHAQAAARDEETTSKAIARLRDLLPAPEPIAKQEVPVVFWTYSAQGPLPSLRQIAVPEWEEIRKNYSNSTRAGLEAIMRGFRPAHGGQLVLWHGEAGTGKTFALRALAWEWREWCQIHYVVDPDTFFGQHADYLMTVLMQSGGIDDHVAMLMSMHGHGVQAGWTSYGPAMVEFESEAATSDDEEGRSDLGSSGRQQWRLLVLEDTGELLRPDAKSIIGQGLSRFLNVVDGLIGQGLRVLVLVTTNERLEGLHPAVARPGRCAANVEFDLLSEEEATAWLQAHGAADGVTEARLLASLYAQLEGRDPKEAQLARFAE